MTKFYQEDRSRLSNDFIYPANSSSKSRSSNILVVWLKKRYRRWYVKLLKLRGKPIVIARGIAVGVFAGCFPFFGLQTLIGILLATLIRGSKVAAAAATWISNPLTYVPLFVFNFKVGKLLLGVRSISSKEIDLESLNSFMELGYKFATTLLVGCFVVGIILSVASYFISLYIFKNLRQRKH